MNLLGKNLIFYLLLGFYAPIAYANIAAYHSPTPGGIAIIPLPTVGTKMPIVTYQGNRVLTIKDSYQQKRSIWLAIIGVPLSIKPGNQTIKLHTTGGIKTLFFKVKPKFYPTERINFRNHRQIKTCRTLLTKLDLRILREFKEIENIYRNWLNTSNISQIQLQWPIHGRKSSAFGLKRIFNGVPKNPHSGLDIAAPEGTPVRAPKDGIVIKTKRYFLTGNAVFLDHGQGFITSYFHLKTIYSKVGKKIKQGEIIGLVGKTGRATGPHLHWSVSLNGVRVNPELFLPKRGSSL